MKKILTLLFCFSSIHIIGIACPFSRGNNYKDTTLEMVFVQGGTFEMGCTSEQQDCESDTKPVHNVTLHDFYIGKYEVTQKQWFEIMSNNPSKSSIGDDYPVEGISWDDIYYFLEKLNQKTGKNYRLPSEAEWEYAARGGGQKTMFGNGKNIIDPKEINFNAQKYKTSYSIEGEFRGKTIPVGSLNSPNALGLHDMSGNLWEWCEDWYDSNYYSNSPSRNPVNYEPGGVYHIIRGGSWNFDPAFCRVAARLNGNSGTNYIGFRLALSVK